MRLFAIPSFLLFSLGIPIVEERVEAIDAALEGQMDGEEAEEEKQWRVGQ